MEGYRNSRVVSALDYHQSGLGLIPSSGMKDFFFQTITAPGMTQTQEMGTRTIWKVKAAGAGRDTHLITPHVPLV